MAAILIVSSAVAHAQAIDFTSTATTANCGPFTVQFSPDVPFAVDSFFWDFGDGQTSTDSSPVHIYYSPGSYAVSLGVVESGTLTMHDTTKADYISLGGVLISQDVLTMPTCYGTSDGEISVNVVGGAGGYTFTWFEKDTMTGTFPTVISTTAGISNVPAGIYKVVVSDANGCVNERIFDLLTSAPKEMNVTFGVIDESCAPGDDGVLWIEQMEGGTPPYLYQWSVGGWPQSTYDTIDSLPSGNYAITIVDNNGCDLSTSAFVDSMRLLPEIEVDMEMPLCKGDANGKAWVVDAVTNYPFAHTIAWSNGNVGDTAYNLVSGVYRVSVSETSTWCYTEREVYVADPDSFRIDVIHTTDPICLAPIGCFGGEIFLNVTGGSEPYNYHFGTGTDVERESVTGLADGTFSYSVTDANGCNASTSATLLQGSGFTTDRFTTSDRTSICSPLTVDFHALNTGAVGNSYWFTFSDGDTAYGESVSHTFTQPGVYDFTFHAILDPGVYVDSTVYGSIRILEPSVSVVNQQDATCGNSDGFIDIEVNNVSPSYTVTWTKWNNLTFTWVNWTDPYSVQGEDLFNIPSGSYQVLVEDSLGCSVQQSFTIGDRGFMNLNFSNIDVICNDGNDGMAIPTVTGGVQPLNYLWSNGAVTTNAIDLSAGTYSLTVVDSSGCSVNSSTTISEPTPLFTNMGKQDESCSPGGDGKAWVTATGGVPGYAFMWSGGTPAGVSGDTVVGLVAGTYYVTVVDANGCEKTDSVTILSNGGASGPQVVLNTTAHVSCFGLADGSVDIFITGGVAPYNYDLVGSFVSGTVFNSSPFNISGLAAGAYTLNVTDANGCFNMFTFLIQEPQQISISLTKVDASCSPGNDGVARVIATGGTTPYTYDWDNRQISNYDTIQGLAAGWVHVTVTDMNNCSATDSIYIDAGALGTAVLDSTNITCFGSGDGKAWIPDAATLYPTLTNYLWSNSGTTDTLYTPFPGTYTVTLTDASFNCSVTGSVIIEEPDSFYLVVDQIVDATCSTCDDGEVYFSNFGGTLFAPWGYAYEWSNGYTTQDQTGLLPGPYGITITDENGCSIDTTVIVGYGQQCQALLDLGNDTTLCFPFFNIGHNLPLGSIDTHLWSTGETSPSININTTGTYHLYTIDTFGCTDHDSITVSFATPAITAALGDTLICDGGYAQLAATGGISYNWSPATGLSSPTLANPSASPSSPEFYTVTITDANGCITTHDVLVDVDSTCVWPGDANFDGIANNDDVLAIGLVYGQSGLVRPNASLAWEGQPVPSDITGFPNWDINKHVDCNGDGTIDNLDTNAVTVNYGLTHLKWDDTGRRFVDPSLYFVLPDSVAAGQVVDIPVMLGRDVLPVDSAYGIIFSINYDNTIVADTPVVFNTTNSWLGTDGVDLLGYKYNLYQSSRTDVAITRIDGISRGGFGQIGTVSMTMKDDISGKTYLAVDMDLSFSNVKLIDARGNIVPTVSEDGVLRVFDPSTSSTELILASDLRMFPNPTNGLLNLALPGQNMETVKLMNVLGEEVYTQDVTSDNTQLNLNELSAGTYFVQVKVQGNWLTRKLILTK